MKRITRPLLMLGLVALVGCAAMERARRTADPKTWASTEKLVKEERLPEAVASLQGLSIELQPAVRGNNGLTRYGDLVRTLVRKSADDTLDRAEELAKRSNAPPLDLAVAEREAVEGVDLVLGLPIDELKDSHLTKTSLTERRAAVAKRLAERTANAERQVAAVQEDEKAGRVALALYEWSGFVPASAEQQALREERLLALSKVLFAESGGRLALETAPGAFANAAGAVETGLRRAQARHKSITLVPAKDAEIAIAFTAVKPEIKRSSGTVTLEWKYPSGKKEVDNPDYAKLQKKIAELDKKAADQKGTYDRTSCGRGGSVRGRTKYPGGDCAKAYYQAWQKYSKDADAARKSLSRTKPRKVETVYSIHKYQAKEDVAEAVQLVEAKLVFSDGRPPEVLKGKATAQTKAYTHAAHPPVKLPARAEKLPTDEQLLTLVTGDMTKRVGETIDVARKRLAARLDEQLAKASDKPTKADLLLRKVAVTGSTNIGWVPVIEAAQERMGKPFGEPASVESFMARGQQATLWERAVTFAEEELRAGRAASALLGWYTAAPAGDAQKGERKAKLEELKAQVAAYARVEYAVRPGSTPQAAGVAGRLESLVGAYRHWEKAEASPKLVVTLDAPAPKITRSASEVELEQEVVLGEEEVDNPDYVARVAAISDAEEKGNFDAAELGKMFLSAVSPTLKQKITETHPYKARRAVAELEGEVTVKVSFGGEERTLTVPVPFEKEAFAHPARAATKLEARDEKLADDAGLRAEWEAVAAAAVRDALVAHLHEPREQTSGPVLDALVLKTLRTRGKGPARVVSAFREEMVARLGDSSNSDLLEDYIP